MKRLAAALALVLAAVVIPASPAAAESRYDGWCGHGWRYALGGVFGIVTQEYSHATTVRGQHRHHGFVQVSPGATVRYSAACPKHRR